VSAAQEAGVSTPVSNDSYDPAKAVHHVMYDTSKAAKLLGLKYRSIKESTRDMIEDFKARGWL